MTSDEVQAKSQFQRVIDFIKFIPCGLGIVLIFYMIAYSIIDAPTESIQIIPIITSVLGTAVGVYIAFFALTNVFCPPHRGLRYRNQTLIFRIYIPLYWTKFGFLLLAIVVISLGLRFYELSAPLPETRYPSLHGPTEALRETQAPRNDRK
jgi:hypothetical protein